MHSSQWCGAGFLLSLSSSLSACQIYFVAKERPAPSQSHTLRSWTTNQHTLQTRIFNHKRNNNNKLHVFDDERKEREWMSERERETCRIHIITIAVGYTSRHSGQMHSSGSSGPEWRIHQYGFIDKVKVFFFLCVSLSTESVTSSSFLQTVGWVYLCPCRHYQHHKTVFAMTFMVVVCATCTLTMREGHASHPKVASRWWYRNIQYINMKINKIVADCAEKRFHRFQTWLLSWFNFKRSFGMTDFICHNHGSARLPIFGW